MLLKREVIERMVAAHPETRYTKQHVGGDSACTEYFALFDCMVVDGEYISEDYGFCRRWRAIGGTIWLDMEGRLTHTGPHTFEMPKTPR